MPHAEATLPFLLDTPAFKQAWASYLEHRKENRMRPLRSKSVQAQWDHLASHGPEVAVAAIELTIRSGWQGIFPEKVEADRRAGSPNPVRHPDYRASLGALQIQLQTIKDSIRDLRNPSGMAYPPPLTGADKARCDELIRQRNAIQDRIDHFFPA